MVLGSDNDRMMAATPRKKELRSSCVPHMCNMYMLYMYYMHMYMCML